MNNCVRYLIVIFNQFIWLVLFLVSLKFSYPTTLVSFCSLIMFTALYARNGRLHCEMPVAYDKGMERFSMRMEQQGENTQRGELLESENKEKVIEVNHQLQISSSVIGVIVKEVRRL